MKIETWHAFLVWVAVTLTAIACIGDAPWVGLGIALGGGAAFGAVTWYAARRTTAFDLKRFLK